MMYKSIFKAVGVVAAAVFFCVECGSDGGGKPTVLVGHWICIDDHDDEEMELFSDGTIVGKAKGMSIGGTWNVVDKRLVMTVTVMGSAVSQAADYKISGHELTITDNDGKTSRYVKKENLEKFKATQTTKLAKSGLVGHWIFVVNGSEMELLSNGTMVIEEDTGTWNIVNERLLMMKVMVHSHDTQTVDYKISGDELTIFAGGNSVHLIKKENLEKFKAKHKEEFEAMTKRLEEEKAKPKMAEAPLVMASFESAFLAALAENGNRKFTENV